MRAKEFITEEDVRSLKSRIIGQVKKTNDEDLLSKLYIVLNKSGLSDRIGLVLTRDTDTKSHIQELVDLIIDVPGSYAEKESFIKGYPSGYVDVEKMLSGEYIKFDNLITGGEGTPVSFVKRVFNALKQTTFGGAKGPGEFGLAVLSPHIKITGKGDLNIGDRVIEVKANATGSGGRLGTPGMLSVDNIPQILDSHLQKYKVPEKTTLSLKNLPELLNKNQLTPDQKRDLCSELFTYIFKGKVDVSELVNAIVSNRNPEPYFLKANYELYRQISGFDGMLLVNFPAQACKYFTDPSQMAEEVNAIGVCILSASQGFEARQILSQVTLTRVKEPKQKLKTVKVDKPKKQATALPQQTEPNIAPAGSPATVKGPNAKI